MSKRGWYHLKYVQVVLRNRAKDKRLPKYQRDLYDKLYKRLLWHEGDVEDAITEALMQGIRNPAFPDDLVGWLDDDFDLDDDDEEKDKDD